MKPWICPKDGAPNKVGNMAQIAGIRRFRFCEGKADGVEAAEIRTGSGLEFTVLPGRGMDIAQVSYKGVSVSYLSKTGIVSPTYYDCHDMNWLRTFFAGAITTCGLTNTGNPEPFEDRALGQQMLSLHGRISNTAAEQVGVYEEWEDGEYVMRVTGKVQEAILHGEHLSLRRTVTTALGKKEFVLHDCIRNHGQYPQPLQLLYHVNFGYPLLDACTRVALNSEEVVERTGTAAEEQPDGWTCCEEPRAGHMEGGYVHRLGTGADGLVHACIVNEQLELGVEIVYSLDELPFMNQWKVMNAKEYVVAFEPGNALPIGRKAMGDRVQVLQPNEEKQVTLTYRILDGEQEIQAALNRI